MGPYRLQKVTPRADVGTLNSAIEGLGRAGNALQQFDSLEAKSPRWATASTSGTAAPAASRSASRPRASSISAKDTARLRGVVVPAFALNNLLSNVPLLGPLLTGGKDGGLFAISYQLHGPLDDLKTNVNMMSAVTPGALRELFNAPPDGGPRSRRCRPRCSARPRCR